MSNNQDNLDNQAWDVFRYVAGEMTSEEELRFEKLLAEDQSLREHVARTVSNLATIDNAFAASKVSPAAIHRNEKLRIRRILVSMVALIAIAALAVNLTIQNPTTGDDAAESIAIAWAESVESNEFELEVTEYDDTYASIDFESSDDDWIADVVMAVNDSAAEIN